MEIQALNISNWNNVPTNWKNVSIPKPVKYTVSPYDKNFLSLVSFAIGSDSIRPIFSAIHFDSTGATVTDAHKLIHIAIKDSGFSGNYATPQLEKLLASNEDNIKYELEKQFPNWRNVIPKPEYTYKVDAFKLLQYTSAAVNLANKTTHQVAYKFGTSKIGFNGNFLIDILKFMLKADETREIYVHIKGESNGVIFSYDDNFDKEEDTFALLMPVFLNTDNLYSNQLGSFDMDFNQSMTVYFDFNDGEIHNQDGSIAEFKEKYDKLDSELPEEIAKKFKRFQKQSKSSYLPILEYVCVDEKGIRVTNLASTIILQNTWNIPHGLYSINNNALQFDFSVTLDDFPMLPDIEETQYVPVFKISSQAFKYYIDKLNECRGDDDLRPIMHGISLEISKGYDKPVIKLTATDANVLASIDIADNAELLLSEYDNFSIIMDQIDALDLFFEMDENDQITFSVGSAKGLKFISSRYTNYKIESSKNTFISRTIDGKYPNWTAVIPTVVSRTITFNSKELLECLNTPAAKAFWKKHDRAVTVAEKDGKIILINSASIGRGYASQVLKDREIYDVCSTSIVVNELDDAKEISTRDSLFLIMPIVGEPDSLNFNFNYTLLLRAIDVIGQDEITMYNTTKERAYVILPKSFKFNEAPIRTTSVAKKAKAAEETAKKAAEAAAQKASAEAKKAEAQAKADAAKAKKIAGKLEGIAPSSFRVGDHKFVKLNAPGIKNQTAEIEIIETIYVPEPKEYVNLKISITEPHYIVRYMVVDSSLPALIGKQSIEPESYVESNLIDKGMFDQSKSAPAPRIEKITYRVMLGSAWNPSNLEVPKELQVIKPYSMKANTIEQATALVKKFIHENDVKRPNWLYGQVIEDTPKKAVVGKITFEGEYVPATETDNTFPPTEAGKKDFFEYVSSFYGKPNGLYAKEMNGGFSQEEIMTAIDSYIASLAANKEESKWGGGDSLDRERVREILLNIIAKPAKEETKESATTEPTVEDYKSALAGAKTMLKYAEKSEKEDLKAYIEGLNTMLSLMK